MCQWKELRGSGDTRTDGRSEFDGGVNIIRVTMAVFWLAFMFVRREIYF